MQHYLSNLIPRLVKYSQSLSQRELFIDQPWVLMDEDQNRQQYIFKRNGQLIMSLNGNVQMGNWEYIAPAASLLVDRGVDKILLNQGFIDKAVLVLKKDGSGQPFFLANQRIIPDLNVERYLRQMLRTKEGRQAIELDNGKELEYTGEILDYSAGVYIDGQPAPDGVYETGNSTIRITIANGSVDNILYEKKYDTDRGAVTLLQSRKHFPSPGDVMLRDNLPAPDGVYKLVNNEIYLLKVKDSRVTKIRLQNATTYGIVALLVVLLLIVFIMIVVSAANK